MTVKLLKGADQSAASAAMQGDLWNDGGVTTAEAARFTSLSLRTIKGRIQSGKVPVARIGRRIIVPRRFLTTLLAENTTGGK